MAPESSEEYINPCEYMKQKETNDPTHPVQPMHIGTICPDHEVENWSWTCMQSIYFINKLNTSPEVSKIYKI